MGTGHWARACAIASQSRRACLVRALRRSFVPLFCSSCYKVLKRNFELYNARVMLQSSLNSVCHCRREVVFLASVCCRRVTRRSSRCCGRCIVRSVLLMLHPRRRFWVLKVALPSSVFDVETNGHQGESGVSWNTQCKCCRRLLRVAMGLGCWARIVKLSK
jgi:hypothetical protein